MRMDPRISLAIDNCFASKRWTRPSDWMPLVRELGINLVEASADTECDPLYMGKAYTDDWVDEVRRCTDRFGVRVVNLYSGHGTYATLGLAHTDDRVRVRFRDEWMKAQARTARRLNAGLGFFAHAIHEPALQDPAAYAICLNRLVEDLAELAAYASDIGLCAIGVEQMYSPHQPPWTRKGTRELLKRVYQTHKNPFYVTLDLGHMNGQQYFQKPTPELIGEWLDRKKAGKPCKGMWLGPESAYAVFNQAAAGFLSENEAAAQIQSSWEGYEHLFADAQDGCVQTWLEEFACYSPIIHLQQSDGKASPHWPFSPAFNEIGIIRGAAVLHSIGRAFSQKRCSDMPPMQEEIILTLEPFIGTVGNIHDALEQIGQSVCYWREFIPRDGMLLSEILEKIAE